MAIERAFFYHRAIVRWAAIVSALWVAGCGWQLQGQSALPASIESIQVRSMTDQRLLGYEIVRQLKATQVTVVDSTADADVVLEILQDRWEQELVSVGLNGKAQEYGVLMRAAFRVSRHGETVLPAQNLVLRRVYIVDPQNELSNEWRVLELVDTLRVDMARTVIRRLRALEQADADFAR
ncbi:MAG: hypothetical protein SVU69_08345 [Pseudomonadota bacterium]|nr:hypothetical protein [Pseudomonadota bacterium]